MMKFGLLLCCIIAITGCQVTSGQLRSKVVTCNDIESEADFRGSKPRWNVFGDVTRIRYCRAPRQTQHKFTMANGTGSSQISNSDVVVFHEITERVFREMLSSNSEFQFVAQTIGVKQISNDGRPTIYAIRGRYKRPMVYFVMNDGFPAAVMSAWSQVHVGSIKSPIPMSAEDFEAWFLRIMRTFKYTGGDYASAFTPEAKNARPYNPGGQWASKSHDMSVKGDWEGVSNNLLGNMTTTPGTETGAVVLSLADQKDRCFGTWTITEGAFNSPTPPKGIWSVDCESKVSASGSFVAEKEWHGEGKGRDSKGRNITFSYKPKSEY